MTTNRLDLVSVPGVEEDIHKDNVSKKNHWKPFLRQLLISSGVWLYYFSYGMSQGAPTVFIPQIRSENNSTAAVGDEMASWLSSTMNISGAFCVLAISYLSRHVGRKICVAIASVGLFAGFIVFYTSKSIHQILISQVMHGVASAAEIAVCVVVITEYTSPQYRVLFLTIKAATMYCGIWASNALGTFLHWRSIGLAGIVCSLYAVITVMIWPESPYWLASKGRFEECAVSHRWLKGSHEQSEKELKTLIDTKNKYLKELKGTSAESLFTSITSREFYRPFLIAVLCLQLCIFSGKLVYTVYAIDILKKFTEDESTAYIGMLILDGITVLSMYVGCVTSKFFNHRTWLLVSSTIGVVFLYSISLYLYLIDLNVIKENKYASLCLLVMFSTAVSCGPLIMSSSAFGELMPLRSRNLAACLVALIARTTISILLKIAPYLFQGFGLHGAFLFFGLCSSCIIVALYKYLPETKDKTLQEIADSVIGIRRQPLKENEEDTLLQ